MQLCDWNILEPRRWLFIPFPSAGPTCPPEEESASPAVTRYRLVGSFFWREKTLTCDDFKSYMAHNCRYFLQQHLIYSNLLQLPQRIVNLNFWIFTDLFRVLEINKMQHFDRCNALKIIQRILFFGGINRFTFSNERARALTLSLQVARFGFSGVQTNPDTASTRVCLLDIILGRRRDRESWTFFKNWKRGHDSFSKCYLTKCCSNYSFIWPFWRLSRQLDAAGIHPEGNHQLRKVSRMLLCNALKRSE